MKCTLFRNTPQGASRHVAWFALVALSLVNAFLLVWFTPEQSGSLIKSPRVDIIRVTDASCPQCGDTQGFVDALKSWGATIVKDTSVDTQSWYGTLLVRRYGITKTPTVLVRGDIHADSLRSLLLYGGAEPGERALGSIRGNAYVLEYVFPPYRDVSTKTVRGSFDLIKISDISCAGCYDPALHEQALAQLSMKPAAVRSVDAASPEGKELISRYGIETIPTIILQGDLGVYTEFDEVWKTVGSVESDGAHVFRTGQDLMGTYRNLKTGVLVNKQ